MGRGKREKRGRERERLLNVGAFTVAEYSHRHMTLSHNDAYTVVYTRLYTKVIYFITYIGLI